MLEEDINKNNPKMSFSLSGNFSKKLANSEKPGSLEASGQNLSTWIFFKLGTNVPLGEFNQLPKFGIPYLLGSKVINKTIFLYI